MKLFKTTTKKMYIVYDEVNELWKFAFQYVKITLEL